MSNSADLLRKAYQLIGEHRPETAKAILNSLTATDPFNVEVWKAYMQVSETCEELDVLCDRVLRVSGFAPSARESILDYYYCIRQRMKSCEGDIQPSNDVILFELVDEFTYTLKDTRRANPEHILDRDHGWRQSMTWLASKAGLILFLFFLVVGYQLISAGSFLGYWVLLILAVSIFVNLWNSAVVGHETGQPTQLSKPDASDSKSKRAQII